MADQAASNPSSKFALNLSSAGMLPRVFPQVCELLPKCDYIFGNREELRAVTQMLAKVEPKNCADTDAARARALVGLLPTGAVVVITGGTLPTLIADREQGSWSVPVPAVPLGDVVDTNGCGDAFVGGFLGRLVSAARPDGSGGFQGPGGSTAACSVRECVEEGHRCAGLILRRRGCSLD